MSRNYIENHFEDIAGKANAIENRLDDSWLNADALIRENEKNLAACIEHGCTYILIDGEYSIDL